MAISIIGKMLLELNVAHINIILYILMLAVTFTKLLRNDCSVGVN